MAFRKLKKCIQMWRLARSREKQIRLLQSADGRFPREGTHEEENKAATLEANSALTGRDFADLAPFPKLKWV